MSDLARKISGKELLLLLIYTPIDNQINYPIRGRTRLAKMVFLFRQELWGKYRFDKVIPEDILPDFEPWKFGPYSKEVFSDINFLRSVDFLVQRGKDEPASREEAIELSRWSEENEDIASVEEYSEEKFQLSDDGVRYINEKGLWDLLSNNQKKALRKFKEKMVNAPLYSILRYVYEKYPEMAEESEIQDRIYT